MPKPISQEVFERLGVFQGEGFWGRTCMERQALSNQGRCLSFAIQAEGSGRSLHRISGGFREFRFGHAKIKDLGKDIAYLRGVSYLVSYHEWTGLANSVLDG